MSSSGSISSMNSTVRQNRNWLPSKKSGGYRKGYDGQTLSKKKIKDKVVSEDQLELIKQEIRRKTKRERNMRKLVFFFTSTFLISLILLVLLV